MSKWLGMREKKISGTGDRWARRAKGKGVAKRAWPFGRGSPPGIGLWRIPTVRLPACVLPGKPRGGFGSGTSSIGVRPACCDAPRLIPLAAPKIYLLPGIVDGWRADKRITSEVLCEACQEAVQTATGT